MWKAVFDAGQAVIQWIIANWTVVRRILNAAWNRPVALCTAILLLLASVTLTAIYWTRSARYEAVVTNTIGARTEATGQEYKGLESFIFASVRASVAESLRTAPLNTKFINAYGEFHAKLMQLRSSDPNSSTNDIKLVLQKNGNGVLTDGDPQYDGFLFLPEFLLHVDRATLNKVTGGTPLILRSPASTTTASMTTGGVYSRDDSLFSDIELTRAMAGTVQEKLTSVPLIADGVDVEATRYLNRHPAQVYIITKEGLNRIFTHDDAHPSDEFEFPSDTFFPSRPYFWPAVHEHEANPQSNSVPKIGDKVGDFFHVSQPYLDLGGSGVVITLSRILDAGDVVAVICFDLVFDMSQSLYAALTSNVTELGGTPLQIDCTVPVSADPECKGLRATNTEGQPLTPDETFLVKKVQDRLGESKEDYARSTVLGALCRYDTTGLGSSPSRVVFSLPMYRKFDKDGTQNAKLLVVDLDLNEYKLQTTYIAFGAATCFGLMTVTFAYFWGAGVMRQRELEAAFQEVATVMYDSPTPYVRLDSKDRIQDASASLCKMIMGKCGPEVLSELKSRTFRSFLADSESQLVYKDVEEARTIGQPVASYVLKLSGHDNTEVRVRVFSAAIPTVEGQGLPSTFGILVELAREVRSKPTSAGERHEDSPPDLLSRKVM